MQPENQAGDEDGGNGVTPVGEEQGGSRADHDIANHSAAQGGQGSDDADAEQIQSLRYCGGGAGGGEDGDPG